MKILHVLANSSPDINGYAVRTQMLLQHQQELEEIENVALTSPWYPHRESMIEEYSSHGVKYLRTLHPSRRTNRKISLQLVDAFSPKLKTSEVQDDSLTRNWLIRSIKKIPRVISYFSRIGWKVVEEKILIRYFTRRIIEVAKEENADLIHAHTPYRVGLPALKAARKLKLPFVYEMRGMWEETAVANGRWMRNGPAYRRFQAYETKVLRKADQVICISETLKDEAISRGVNPAKISIVTNAVERKIVEENEFSKHYPAVEDQLSKNHGACTVGYIGSLREMEGVDLTAKAVARLISKGMNVQFFVLTGPSGQEELRNLCSTLGIEKYTTITGPVPHQEVAAFYRLIDVFVVSRPDSRVTQLVTPLKPFEAMAMGRTVVASKLAALEEIIQHGNTGLLYSPDDLDDLAKTIELCVTQPDLREELGKAAQRWVLKNRTWDTVVENTRVVYERAQA